MPRHPNEPLRLGIVGTGRFGILHALTAAGLAEAELVALVDEQPETLELARRLLPHVPSWTDLNQALSDSGADAWVVATTTATHARVARAILEAGRPVLVEKPLGTHLADARLLAPWVRPDSSNLMMGHILLFSTELRQLQEEVRERGPVVFIQSVRHRPATTLESHPGENPLHLLMVHDLYLTLVLLKRAEPSRFHAQLHRHEKGGQDLAVAELEWPDGALVSCAASFLSPAGMAGHGFDRLEVFGTNWMARVQPNPRPIELWDERARWPLALEIRANPNAPSGMLAEELRCFCRVARGLEPVPVGATYADALQIQGWLAELERSASNNSAGK